MKNQNKLSFECLRIAFFLALTLLFFTGCNDKNDSPEPDKGTNGNEVHNPISTTDMFGEAYTMEYNGDGKIVKSVSKSSGSYRAYRYLSGQVVRSFYNPVTKTETDDSFYLLDEKGRLKELSFPGISGGTARRFNYQYDGEEHVTSFETDSKNSSGQTTYHYRHEWEWKGGNLTRSRQLDLLRNRAVVNDRTYEYDLSRKNTLYPQALAVRPTMGILDPNFNINMFAGKGPNNVLIKDISTADPSKQGIYTYTYDGEGRTTSVTYLGDKMTVGY